MMKQCHKYWWCNISATNIDDAIQQYWWCSATNIDEVVFGSSTLCRPVYQ